MKKMDASSIKRLRIHSSYDQLRRRSRELNRTNKVESMEVGCSA
jgi:hypothetical protein